jgi:hypothetical protein
MAVDVGVSLMAFSWNNLKAKPSQFLVSLGRRLDCARFGGYRVDAEKDK